MYSLRRSLTRSRNRRRWNSMTTPRSLTSSYVKYDYIPCSRQRKKSNNVDKETRTIQQLCDDTQWILQCELGATRGRAMAMLMDSQYECSDVDEAHLHIVLGPKSDLKVRIKSDEDLEDDPRAELFEDDTWRHHTSCACEVWEEGQCYVVSLCQSNSGTDDSSWTQAMVMTWSLSKKSRGWILTHMRATRSASTRRTVWHPLDGWLTWTLTPSMSPPRHMSWRIDTPSVLSLGKRYMEQGYSFALPSDQWTWSLYDQSWSIPPVRRSRWRSGDLIPFVYLCDEEYRPTTGKEAKMVAKILGLMKDNVNRTIYIDG